MTQNLSEFKIQDKGKLSRLILSKDILTINSFIHFLKHLPYGRNSNRTDFSMVITEGKGSCSSKHACLKSLAVEQDWNEVQLVLCLYKMNNKNTPGIGTEMKEKKLAYIPEAHCYTKIKGVAYDLTNKNSSIDRISKDILEEEFIAAEQVVAYKVERHKAYIKNWIKEEKLDLTFAEAWAIRERCIISLSTPQQN